MVIARNAVIGASIVGGMAGGFALDRRAAETPLREFRRTPEIARNPDVREDELAGATFNNTIAFAPPGVAIAGGLTFSAMATSATGAERFISRYPPGLLALATAITGASMTAGVVVSRIGLG